MNSPQTPYPKRGTTSPIFVPRCQQPEIVRPGADYFFVQIHSAQAAFVGSFWEKVKSLIIATQVQINHPSLDQGKLRSIQRTREVKRGKSEQLGLSSNLISLVPAIMADISVSIDFILDKENSLHALSGLINKDSFLSAISLAPGAALVAKTISNLAGDVIEAFIPAEDRQPILEFSGDFNLTGEGLREGYYVILDRGDGEDTLPDPLPKLQISNGELLFDGKTVTNFSYIILDVRRTPARTRALNNDAVWEKKLREAEDIARRFAYDPLVTPDERKAAWNKCLPLIIEGQALLRNDINYHRSEAETIIKAVFDQCIQDLGIGEDRIVVVHPERVHTERLLIDMPEVSKVLNIPLDEDLPSVLADYDQKVVKSRQVLEEIGYKNIV